MKNFAEIYKENTGKDINNSDVINIDLANKLAEIYGHEVFNDCKQRITESYIRKMRAAIWAAFLEFEPYIDSDIPIDYLHEKYMEHIYKRYGKQLDIDGY